MAVELTDEKKKSLKEIYNDSVRLLELLNVLIPKVESYKPQVEAALVQEIADKCFELGANLATNIEDLQGKDEEPDLEYGNYPYGI